MLREHLQCTDVSIKNSTFWLHTPGLETTALVVKGVAIRTKYFKRE